MLLAVDESVPLLRVALVAPANVVAFAPDGADDGLLGACLGRPAPPVRGQA
jgi:hypothetical protein